MFTLGSHITDNAYHVSILRTQLTRALPQLVSGLHAEMTDAFSQFIPPTDGKYFSCRFQRARGLIIYFSLDWSGVKILEVTRTIVALLSGRVFVGLPLSVSLSIHSLSKNLSSSQAEMKIGLNSIRISPRIW